MYTVLSMAQAVPDTGDTDNQYILANRNERGMCLPRKLESESPSVKSRTFAFNQPSLSFGESWGLLKSGVTNSGSNTEQLPRKKIHGSRLPPLWPPPLHRLPPVTPAPVPACSHPGTFYRFWIIFPAPTGCAPPRPPLYPPPARYHLHALPHVYAQDRHGPHPARGQGMGDDTALARMGLGPSLRSMVCSSVVARGRGACKSAPALAGGETLRVNDEEVSERTEGAWEGVEGVEMAAASLCTWYIDRCTAICGPTGICMALHTRPVPMFPPFHLPSQHRIITPPPASHLPPSHNPPAPHHKKPYDRPLHAWKYQLFQCLESTVRSRAWEMFAPDNQGSGAINSVDNPPDR
ncbi:hypothetical protein JB92DRAFT_2835244 [Gautieria morchelliformis]|nr:hypothetical protein JB92DRAFT_2835244 [Gautieria morchelliformis]